MNIKLESTGVAIPVASGWQTLADNGGRSLTDTFDSVGGTVLEVRLNGSANVATGAATRVIINGGSFAANIVITPDPAASMLLPGNVRISQSNWIAIPATADPVTYTVTAQGQGVGILASVTPNAGTNLIAHEHA